MVIVRTAYRVDGEIREDQADGPDYEAAKAALPDRGDLKRLWFKVERGA
jgi:hypothetical protein